MASMQLHTCPFLVYIQNGWMGPICFSSITKENTIGSFLVLFFYHEILPPPGFSLSSYLSYKMLVTTLGSFLFFFSTKEGIFKVTVANGGRLLRCMFCPNPFSMYSSSINLWRRTVFEVEVFHFNCSKFSMLTVSIFLLFLKSRAMFIVSVQLLILKIEMKKVQYIELILKSNQY